VSTSDHGESNAETTASPRERLMGFWEHLNELRGTIIKSVVVFVAFAGLIGYFFKQFDGILSRPFRAVVQKYPELHLDLGTVAMMVRAVRFLFHRAIRRAGTDAA
jgi:sec-independent protein translocase protein TatC